MINSIKVKNIGISIIVFISIIFFIIGGNSMPINIDTLSVASLYLIVKNGESFLGTATGFIVKHDDTNYLITNWHVLSGRNPGTNEVIHSTGAAPREVLIWHHGETLGQWKLKSEQLYNESGEKRWIEHDLGRNIDIVALPLKNLPNDVKIYPFDLSLVNSNIQTEMAMTVSIIGFPHGLAAGGRFPIWKTGHIASEPRLDFEGKPVFLIDATTRAGMSGSPVIIRSKGTYRNRKGDRVISSGFITRFLGVYSGRLSGDTEIGYVWKPHLIEEILK
ncbi:MAG: serine protease [Candidatus Omnitrophica bacterium]|nr:serine protease [Candidatus Omnitrophota bacterium]